MYVNKTDKSKSTRNTLLVALKENKWSRIELQVGSDVFRSCRHYPLPLDAFVQPQRDNLYCPQFHSTFQWIHLFPIQLKGSSNAVVACVKRLLGDLFPALQSMKAGQYFFFTKAIENMFLALRRVYYEVMIYDLRVLFVTLPY